MRGGASLPGGSWDGGERGRRGGDMARSCGSIAGLSSVLPGSCRQPLVSFKHRLSSHSLFLIMFSLYANCGPVPQTLVWL
jgi:hypothetical protein